jgi:hypothetical protein
MAGLEVTSHEKEAEVQKAREETKECVAAAGS